MYERRCIKQREVLQDSNVRLYKQQTSSAFTLCELSISNSCSVWQTYEGMRGMKEDVPGITSSYQATRGGCKSALHQWKWNCDGCGGFNALYSTEKNVELHRWSPCLLSYSRLISAYILNIISNTLSLETLLKEWISTFRKGSEVKRIKF